MENLITVNTECNSLDALNEQLKKKIEYNCSKEYDTWEQRTDANGQLAQCIVIKKSEMHAVKLFHINENTVKINYIIPNKTMHAYFGKSVKARRNILEIITGKIKEALLAPAQKKAFQDLELVVTNATV